MKPKRRTVRKSTPATKPAPKTATPVAVTKVTTPKKVVTTTTKPASKPTTAPKKATKVTASKAVTTTTTRRTASRRAAPVAPATTPAPRRRPVASATPTTVVHSNNPWPWIVGAILLVVLCLLAFGAFYALGSKLVAMIPPVAAPLPPVVGNPAPAAPIASSYPLAGQTYSSPQGHEYDALWTLDGRLWQPQLPAGNLRKAHTVGITIEEGSYAFDGVECQLFVDPSRNGAGAKNPVTAEYGNDLRFVVDTVDGGQAWGLVECRGNFSSGFQIRFLGQ